MNAFSGKKLLLLGFVIVLLVVIPLTVYLVQQQQKIITQAAATSILSVIPATHSMAVGQSKSFEIRLNPVDNQVSFVKVGITYDPTKLETSVDRVTINSVAFRSTLQGPTVTSGNISFTLSVGSDPNSVVKSETLITTISFTALAPTATGATTPIRIERSQSQVLSIAAGDQFNEDVLATANSALVTIAEAAGATPSPTPTPTPSPSPAASPAATPSPTPSPSPSPGAGAGTGVGTTITVSPTPSATPTGTITGGLPTVSPTPQPAPTALPPVGPADLLAKVGGVAVLFTILGVLLLFAL